MNWAQFVKQIGARYRLEPPACRLDEHGAELPEISDDWVLTRITDASVAEFENVRTQHILKLAKDHIYDFRTDTTRPDDGMRYGFLVLKVQVFLQNAELTMRPNSRPGERVRDARPVAPDWTPYRKVVLKDIPTGIGIKSVKLQYKLFCDNPAVPLMIRFAATTAGGYAQELSGPSGVLDLLLVEPETYYVSVSHSKVQYQAFALGWTDRRGQ
jgi:hypothetical protein